MSLASAKSIALTASRRLSPALPRAYLVTLLEC